MNMSKKINMLEKMVAELQCKLNACSAFLSDEDVEVIYFQIQRGKQQIAELRHALATQTRTL